MVANMYDGMLFMVGLQVDIIKINTNVVTPLKIYVYGFIRLRSSL